MHTGNDYFTLARRGVICGQGAGMSQNFPQNRPNLDLSGNTCSPRGKLVIYKRVLCTNMYPQTYYQSLLGVCPHFTWSTGGILDSESYYLDRTTVVNNPGIFPV